MFANLRSRVGLRSIDVDRWLPWLVGLAGFVLYAATAAPSIVRFDDDSLEFQLVGPTLGIAHPTGYPLYTLLGGLWSRVIFPVGNWAWRMNLFSALAGALTVGLVYVLIQRVARQAGYGSQPLAGLIGAGVFALGSVWWSQTTVAEVYALHGLFTAAILYAAVSVPQKSIVNPDGRMTRLFLLFGLSLTHHRTTLLLAPGLAVYLLWQIPGLWRPRWIWLRWVAALSLPLLLYLYLPLRASMGVADLNGDYVNSWAGFWFHVLAQGYAGFFQASSLTVTRTAGEWLGFFVEQMGLFYLVLGIGGWIWLGMQRGAARRIAALLALTGLVDLLFVLNYRVGDPEVFLLPLLMVLAVGAGMGTVWLFSRREITLWSADQVAVAMLLVGIAMQGVGPGFVPPAYTWTAHDQAVAMAKVDFPPQSRVIGIVGEVTALKYMQRSDGLGLNALPVAADDPDTRRTLVAEEMAAGHPVFLTRELAGIENEYSFTGSGPLVRVWPRGQAQSSPPQVAISAEFDDGRLALTGYDLAIAQQAGGPSLDVAFYWQAAAPLTRTLKLSLRLLGPDGETLTVADEFPLHQAAPTWSWLPGEVLRDEYTLPLPINQSTNQPTPSRSSSTTPTPWPRWGGGRWDWRGIDLGKDFNAKGAKMRRAQRKAEMFSVLLCALCVFAPFALKNRTRYANPTLNANPSLMELATRQPRSAITINFSIISRSA